MCVLPVLVLPSPQGERVLSVACGSEHSLAATERGTVGQGVACAGGAGAGVEPECCWWWASRAARLPLSGGQWVNGRSGLHVLAPAAASAVGI